MMWLGLLSRLWPYLAGAMLIVGAGYYLHHTGYESGHAASEAHWKPLFAKADNERIAAEARTATREAQSTLISARQEAEHAAVVSSLTLRADSARRTNADLVRQLNSAASRCEVPETIRAASSSDGARRSDELADRIAADLTDLARRCESDAAKLNSLQSWVTDQQALFR